MSWHVIAAMLAAATPVARSAESAAPEPLASISFSVVGERVVLPIHVGESEPLDVLLDTGMPLEGLLLFHRDAAAMLAGVDFQEVLVPGAGRGKGSRSIMADSILLSCGDALFPNQLVVISQSETTQGFASDGVIGHTILAHHVVELDYDRMILRLFEPAGYEAPDGFDRIEVVLQRGIPFMDATVSVDGSEPVTLRVYIDLASDDALELLVHEEAKFAVPNSLEQVYLGTGLSGDIHGGVGRVASLRIGSFELRDVTAVFPPAEVRSKQENADAILGNGLLRRFNVRFDYPHGCIWLKPNQSFADPFEQEANL